MPLLCPLEFFTSFYTLGIFLCALSIPITMYSLIVDIIMYLPLYTWVFLNIWVFLHRAVKTMQFLIFGVNGNYIGLCVHTVSTNMLFIFYWCHNFSLP